MGRKDFRADLQAAIAAASVNPQIHDLVPGAEDGSIDFICTLSSDGIPPIACTAMIPELADYPSNHTYMIFTNDGISVNVPSYITSLLDQLTFPGKRIGEFLSSFAARLTRECQSRLDRTQDVHMSSPAGDEEESDLDPDFDSDNDADFPLVSLAYDEGDATPAVGQRHANARARPEHYATRLRQDILQTKKAGFRISYKGDLLHEDTGYIQVAIRVAHLGIKEDARKAWDLVDGEYLLLVIKYNSGYHTLEDIANNAAKRDITMRVVLSQNYKISLTEANSICNRTFVNVDEYQSTTRELFVGRPLNELLQQRLALILHYRLAMGMGWQGAEEFYNDHQSGPLVGNEVESKYYKPDDLERMLRFPERVRADHLADTKDRTHSFPLLAMQFVLRHLVRCTDFCLVCHCEMETTFEALRPYVCSKPLCLYQYMSLGFGPSIEREILTQPLVVDLLISFCYSAAQRSALREHPIGMGLMIPFEMVGTSFDQQQPIQHVGGQVPLEQETPPMTPPKATDAVEFDQVLSELNFKHNRRDNQLVVGQWVTLTTSSNSLPEHRRVMGIAWPIVSLGPPIPYPQTPTNDERATAALSIPGRPHIFDPVVKHTRTPPADGALRRTALSMVTYETWTCQFDEMKATQRSSAICNLLKLVPTVTNMVSFLKGSSEKHMSLDKWSDRMPPAVMGILRWIIASNRSCIVQIDSVNPSAPTTERRIMGMPGYAQFRFASGAPDKEQRFLEAVEAQRVAKSLRYPTLFAWHGSPLSNWHGIIREGLNFDKTSHGRTYGHGVYHALDAQVSLGYSFDRGANFSSGWPSSGLQITSALCLNEIVNVPDEFVSRSPHLVVQHLDWIQTRYLFVQGAKYGESQASSMDNATGTPIDEMKALFAVSETLPQDPSMRPLAPTRERLTIPLDAISKSRQALYATATPPKAPSTTERRDAKRLKLTNVKIEQYYISDDTDEEDLAILVEKVAKTPLKDVSKTAFMPGKLDQSTLPLLHSPFYATSNANKALQRELQNTRAVQENLPQQDLGWYLDLDAIDNMYQWIFELHSFDKTLPLAKDMESKDVQSIVLELRFGKDFPFSPPFVRVIRPRFLSFMQGGGGHVTAGGALCMELLTNSGWNPASNVEAVLLQVRMALTSTDPKPARLQPGPSSDYGAVEAREAYIRACQTHGWQVPADFQETASMA
jgi:ubiquitin-conjugating enzyme E2 Q